VAANLMMPAGCATVDRHDRPGLAGQEAPPCQETVGLERASQGNDRANPRIGDVVTEWSGASQSLVLRIPTSKYEE
jgi:hypothetical protein